MRLKSLAVAVLMAAGIQFAQPTQAEAFGDVTIAPERPMVIHHRVYRPYYHHVYHYGGDPYAYRYVQRPWYLSYTSPYWVPASEMRYRYRYTYDGPKYRYHPAWGHSKRTYKTYGYPVK